MSRPALPPAQIIEAARTRLAKAKTAESIRFEECTAVGMLACVTRWRRSVASSGSPGIRSALVASTRVAPWHRAMVTSD